MEKPNKLVDLSVAFAVEILNLVKYLKSQRETIICNQIGRAGTSIGANIHEAQYAQGYRMAPSFSPAGMARHSFSEGGCGNQKRIRQALAIPAMSVRRYFMSPPFRHDARFTGFSSRAGH